MSPSGPAPTALYHLYRGATAVLSPFAWATVRKKLQRADVPVERQQERLGHASLPRPPGQLVWFHAASVGESLSVLTLITRLGERLPNCEFLITSGTPTSAALIAKRLPPRTRHQYAPLDGAGPVDRFYRHWRPDAGIFVESELWPQMIVRGHQAGVRLALLNARLSDKSVEGWKRFPDTSRFILDHFDLFLTQNRKTADNLLAMGANRDRVQPGTNLKAMSAPLPVDEVTLARCRKQIGDRRCGSPVRPMRAKKRLYWPLTRRCCSTSQPDAAADPASPGTRRRCCEPDRTGRSEPDPPQLRGRDRTRHAGLSG